MPTEFKRLRLFVCKNAKEHTCIYAEPTDADNSVLEEGKGGWDGRLCNVSTRKNINT